MIWSRFKVGGMALRVLVAAALLWGTPARAADVIDILPLRERAVLHDQLLRERLDTLIPRLFDQTGVDMWVLVAREYNEDPVVETMLPATWLGGARRCTILVFWREEDGSIGRGAVARYPVGDVFPALWVPEDQPDQWRRLADLITEKNPNRIAINTSATFALADGLSASEAASMRQAFGPAFEARLEPGERLAIGWLETRTPGETALYPGIVAKAHAIIAEAFSSAVITPGITTSQDVIWWLRQRVLEDGLISWFQPSIAIQRGDAAGGDQISLFTGNRPVVIQPGDLLHMDFGLVYMGLHTDTQQMAYVLKDGEQAAPAPLLSALAVGNRLQDHLTTAFAAGKPGNTVLAEALAAARAEEIDGIIYTHPLGLHGHAAGATIGLWDQQGGVPGAGDYPVMPNTAWSIELRANVPAPGWSDEPVAIMLEEDAFFDGESVRYLNGRQRRFHLISASTPPRVSTSTDSQ